MQVQCRYVLLVRNRETESLQCQVTSVIHVDRCYYAGCHVSARYMYDIASVRRPPPSLSGRGKATPLKTSLYKGPKSRTTFGVSAVDLHVT